MPTEAQQLWAKLGSTKSSGIMVTLNLFGASTWIGTIFQSKLRMLHRRCAGPYYREALLALFNDSSRLVWCAFGSAAFVFLRRKHAITEGQAISMRRALLLGDLCFVLAAIFDIILAFYYAFDTTIDWDTSMMVFGIVVAALLWLLCSLIYVWAFFYEFITNKKVLEQEGNGNAGNVDSETGHSPLPPSESEDEDIVVCEQDWM
eukprot:scaffold4199_cov110-Skeletonema_dohrnii-CCMP3373.AAC.1